MTHFQNFLIKKWNGLKRECVKAFDFIVIKGDYLASNPTPERFYEWLARYESYIFGKVPRALGGKLRICLAKHTLHLRNHFIFLSITVNTKLKTCSDRFYDGSSTCRLTGIA